MKGVLPNWLWPMSFFEVYGTMCCHNMREDLDSGLFIQHRFCYTAKSIKEANTLVIWGSLSKKLADTVLEHVETMAKNRFIIHIRGCENRVDNIYCSSSLANFLPVNLVFSNCGLKRDDYVNLIHEARQCLRA